MPELNMPAVEDLIPHRQRMKLIDEIVCVDIDESSLLARTLIKDDWPMCEAGWLDTVVCIEVVAQAVACRHGLAKDSEGGEMGMGFLVGVKSARLHQPRLPVGTELQILATYLYGVDEYQAYSGTVSVDTQLICEAVVQVLSPEPEALKEILSGQGRDGL